MRDALVVLGAVLLGMAIGGLWVLAGGPVGN